MALLNLDVTDGARVSSVAFAGKGGDSIFTHTVMARLRYAVVVVLLAEQAGEAWGRIFLLRKTTRAAVSVANAENVLGQMWF